jgi:hypothetical protein
LTQCYQTPFQTYLKSDVWKCKESLSGAHHWIENKTLYKDHSIFKCVDCGEERQFNNLIKRGKPVKCLKPLT